MAKYFDVAQNTIEWYQARAGVATASQFDKIITKTGKASSQADGYANKLIAELILGRPIDRNFSTYAMEWGEMHEEEARNLYVFDTGFKVQPGGFFTNDDMTFGASPDARIYDGEQLVGLAEIKCPEDPAVHVEFMLMEEMNPKYIPQVQGQLWVSGLEWVDWFSYYPEMPPARIRTFRDEKFLAPLENAMKNFSDIMLAKKQKLMQMGIIEEMPSKEIHVGEPAQPKPITELQY